MFGYITICRPELKVKEYDTYRTYYCGLCHSLKERYGQVPRLTLSFDMTFLAILLSGLYEEENRQSCGRCLLHPMQKALPDSECMHGLRRRYEYSAVLL